MAAGDKQVRALITAKNEAGAALSSFKGGLVAIGAAAAAVTAAFVGLGVAFSKAVDTAKEQQKADVALAAALRTTGQNTKEARQDISDFTDQMQDLTITDDRVVKSVAGVLASLGELSGTELKRATKATLDFAAALGQDANSAALLVAKASGGMVSVLSRYGLTIDDNIPKNKQFNAVLLEMEKKFGGIAEAMGQTFSGRLERVNNDLNDAAELIGDVVVRSEGFNRILDLLSTTAKGFQGSIKDSNVLMKEFEDVLLSTTLAVGRSVVAMAQIALTIAESAAGLGEFIDSIGGLGEKFIRLQFALSGVSEGFGKTLDKINTTTQATDEAETSTTALQRAIRSVIDVLDDLDSGLKTEQENLKRVADLERIVAEEGFNTERGIRALQELTRLRSEPIKSVEEALGNLAPAAEVAVVSVGRVRAQLDELDVAAKEVQEDFAEAVALFELGAEAGGITAEQFDALVEGIKASGQAIINTGGALVDADGHFQAFLTTAGLLPEVLIAGFQEAKDEVISLSQEIQTGLVDEGRQGAQQLGAFFVRAAIDGEASFKQFAKSFLSQIATMIVQALILRAIMTALSFFGGPAGPLVGAAFGSVIAAAEGGVVKGGTPGADSVNALLQPGEIILPASLQNDFGAIADLAEAVRSGRGGVGPNVTIPLTVTGEDDDIRIARLMERLTDAVVREGFTLVASETR